MPTPQPDPSGHYFSPDPSAPSAPSAGGRVLPEGRVVGLPPAPGVLYGAPVDPGPRILLAEGPPVRGPVLADVGCGYGPIAVALALRGGADVVVWAVDVNERARALCAANAAANGVAERVRVVAPDEVPADLVVDQLWSNPPIRIGKAALHDLLSTWLGRLRPGSGTAELVVQKHLGSDSLATWLNHAGWPTVRRTSRAGYRLLSVSAPPGPVAASEAHP